MEIPEIPTNIRYDFFLVVFGGAMAILAIYLNKIISAQEHPIMYVVISLLFLLGGSLFFIIGLGYMHSDYQLDKDLKQGEYVLAKYAQIEQLETKGILTKKSKEALIKELKNIVNNK